jgi:hypothetical protein
MKSCLRQRCTDAERCRRLAERAAARLAPAESDSAAVAFGAEGARAASCCALPLLRLSRTCQPATLRRAWCRGGSCAGDVVRATPERLITRAATRERRGACAAAEDLGPRRGFREGTAAACRSARRSPCEIPFLPSGDATRLCSPQQMQLLRPRGGCMLLCLCRRSSSRMTVPLLPVLCCCGLRAGPAQAGPVRPRTAVRRLQRAAATA